MRAEQDSHYGAIRGHLLHGDALDTAGGELLVQAAAQACNACVGTADAHPIAVLRETEVHGGSEIHRERTRAADRAVVDRAEHGRIRAGLRTKGARA